MSQKIFMSFFDNFVLKNLIQQMFAKTFLKFDEVEAANGPLSANETLTQMISLLKTEPRFKYIVCYSMDMLNNTYSGTGKFLT